jgi:hypothetical protein
MVFCYNQSVCTVHFASLHDRPTGAGILLDMFYSSMELTVIIKKRTIGDWKWGYFSQFAAYQKVVVRTGESR